MAITPAFLLVRASLAPWRARTRCFGFAGDFYENGIGVSKDLGKAEQLYRDAGKLGNEEAKKRLQQLQVPAI